MLITWLFISIFIRHHNFFVFDEKLTVKLLASGIGLQKRSINTDHADYMILKNWFNGSPIKTSERWQGTYKKAECQFCSFQLTSSQR